MDAIKLIARNGEVVRHAIERGDIVHMETASEELTDEFLLFAINGGWQGISRRGTGGCADSQWRWAAQAVGADDIAQIVI